MTEKRRAAAAAVLLVLITRLWAFMFRLCMLAFALIKSAAGYARQHQEINR
jgi:hypothetical protein